MASCRNRFGRLKLAHLTKQAAYVHLSEAQHYKGDAHVMQVYRCPKCFFWHVGHKPRPRKTKLPSWSEKARDEMLVGRLIGILRSKGREQHDQ